MKGTSRTNGDISLQAMELQQASSGVSVLNSLRRLNYFDGKFLRAADLELEQAAARALLFHSNRAGGSGAVEGFTCSRSNQADHFNVSPGLAIDPLGRVLLLSQTQTVPLHKLLKFAAAQHRAANGTNGAAKFGNCEIVTGATPDSAGTQSGYYLVTIAHIEAACDEEEVYGNACEAACGGETARRFLVEGIEIRLRPWQPDIALKTSGVVDVTGPSFARSRLAAAFFDWERRRISSLISGSGLMSEVWCQGAASDALDQSWHDVPIALVSVSGGSLQFLDPWIARRERISEPPQRYWAFRMRMRPWNSFLAEVLQFQCQLRDAIVIIGNQPEPDDPCKAPREAVTEAMKMLERIEQVRERLAKEGAKLPADWFPTAAEMQALQRKLANNQQRQPAGKRLLIESGIVELPSAGYLPVMPNVKETVNQQVRRWFGEGVDLRFCVTTPDFVAHALEEAQHMDRICLLRGLDNPADKPQVDVLVPNGKMTTIAQQAEGIGFEARVNLWGGLPLVLVKRLFEGEEEAAEEHEEGAFEKRTSRTKTARAASYAKAARPFAAVPVAEAIDTSNLLETLHFRFEGAARFEGTQASGARVHVGALLRDVPGLDQVLRVIENYPGRVVEIGDPGSEDGLGDPGAEGAPRVPGKTATAQEDIKIRVQDIVGRMALWTSVRLESDLFAAEIGDSIPASFRLVLAVPGTQSAVLQYAIHGHVVITHTSASSIPVVRARLQGSEHLALKTPSDGRSRVFAANVVCEFAREIRNGVPLFSSRFRLEDAWLTMDARWTSDPIRGRARVTALPPTKASSQPEAEEVAETPIKQASKQAGTKVEGKPIEDRSSILVAQLDVLENADVLRLGNRLHTTALAAIETITKTSGDASFRVEATRALFPPLAPSTSELQIEATEDWVLFHRRRTKICAAKEPPTVPHEPRRYQVFHVALNDGEELERLHKALEAGEVPDGVAPSVVDIVEYSPTSSALLTNPDAVRQDWSQHDPGSQGVAAWIGSVGSAQTDGELVALTRLGSLEQVLHDITQFAESAPRAVLEELPDALRIPGTDGSILIATAGQRLRHCVYLLQKVTEQEWKMLREGDLSSVIREDGGGVEGRSVLLGHVPFSVAGEPLDELDDIVAAWKELVSGGATQAQTLSFVKSGGEEVTMLARHVQLEHLSKTLNVSLRPELLESQETPVECTMVTLIQPMPASEPTTVCHTVYGLRGPAADEIAALLKSGDFAKLEEMKAIIRVGEFGFAGTSLNDPSKVSDSWKSVFGAAVPSTFFTYTFGEGSLVTTQVQLAQAEHLLTTVGGKGEGTTAQSSLPSPGACPIATILQIDTTQKG